MGATPYIRLDGERVAVEGALLKWRRRVLRACLRVVVLGAGGFVWVPSLVVEYRTGQWGLLAVDLICFPPLVWLYLRCEQLPFRLVAHGLTWSLIAMAAGFSAQGELAAHLPIFMGAAVGATILFELPLAKRYVVLIALLVTFFGVALGTGLVPPPKMGHTVWGITVTVLMFLLANGVTLGVAMVIGGLRSAVVEGAQARAEHSRAEADRVLLESIVEQTIDPVALMEVGGQITYANLPFRELIGGDLTPGVRLPDCPLQVDRETLSQMMATADRGAAWTGPLPRGADDRALDATFSAIRSMGVVVRYLLVLRDVTDVRALEHKLRQAQKLEAIGTLSGGIAHDLNNLLVPILTYAELAMSALDKGAPTDTVRDDLSHVTETALQARALVQKILRFSRKSSAEPERIAVGTVARDVAKIVAPSLPPRVRLALDLRAPDATVLADPADIQQVILNLCTNAVHAMRGRDGLMRVTVDLTTPPGAGTSASIVVSDEGCGIAPEAMERLFDPFFTTKGPGEGTGLGLATVHGIVRRLGGTVTVESELGVGTTMSVLLPAVTPQRARPVPRLSGRTFAGHALLVDDELVVLRATTRMLTLLGFDVTATHSPVEALELVREDPDEFSLVISDVCMPVMDGVALAQALRAAAPELPILIMTGNAEAALLDRVPGLGVAAVLHKPVTRHELALAIGRVTRARRAADASMRRTA